MTDSRIARVLNVEQIDQDIFRGPVIESMLQRTFGGQVAAQTLVAATKTVGPEFRVHSLHGYFVGPGRPDQPTVFLVDRIRDGRSFVSRSVKAVQNGHTIFVMQASFHIRDDSGPEHSDVMREVPAPEDITVDTSSIGEVGRRLLQEWSEWDIRHVPADQYQPNPYAASQQVVWLRCKAELPDDETFHICSLTYMSDMTLLSSSKVPHPDTPVQEASLDHALWFLRPFRADEWLLYTQASPSAQGGRALGMGHVFREDGVLVATVAQEGMLRLKQS